MIRRRTFLSSVLTALIISTVLSTTSVQASTVSRIDGGSGGRIGTANKVATDLFGTASNIVLVNGYGYADAVSATPLAKQLNAPILLTGGNTLEPEVEETMQKLGASKVYIVGGVGVVSEALENTLKAKYSVERVAGIKDKTRMGTNAEVAKKVLSLSGQKTGIIVNGKDGYADALSVASIAAQKGYPVLFGSSIEVADVVKDVVSQNGLTVLAVGGEGVLPQAVVSVVGGTKITKAEDSKNRFSTNLAVLKYFKDNGGLDFSKIYLAAGGATSDQFADALVASAAAAKTGSPLVLSGTGADDSQIAAAQNYIVANATTSSNINIIGGTGSVSDDIKNALQSGDTLEIIGIE